MRRHIRQLRSHHRALAFVQMVSLWAFLVWQDSSNSNNRGRALTTLKPNLMGSAGC